MPKGSIKATFLVLAPGLAEFGEDSEIDRLIRKYGYIGNGRVLELVKTSDDLKAHLSAAAHLIHGASDGRFKISNHGMGLWAFKDRFKKMITV